MTRAVAIIGDDLTGTLDAAAPFAARGLSTVVALTPDDLAEALASGAEVVAVNTDSRALPPDEAAARVLGVARALAAASPGIAFKKIDSRLKGNLAAEIEAALNGFGLSAGVIAPAIPDLGRIVEGGAVQGFGVERPIDIAERLGAAAGWIAIPETVDGAALDSVARDCIATASTQLVIGARGLADALALRLAGSLHAVASPVTLPAPIVFAIASRDPITAIQMERLEQHLAPEAHHRAPNGAIPTEAIFSDHDLHLIASMEGATEEAAAIVAGRFAARFVALLDRRPIGTLFLCGGDTAFAVLRRLGIRTLAVGGEALPGIPWSRVTLNGRDTVVLTKSGGFGGPNVLTDLIGAYAARESARNKPVIQARAANGMSGG